MTHAQRSAAAKLGWERRRARGGAPAPKAPSGRKRGRPRGPIKAFAPLFTYKKVGRRSKSHPAGRYEVTTTGAPMGRKRKHYSRPIGPELPPGYVAVPAAKVRRTRKKK